MAGLRFEDIAQAAGWSKPQEPPRQTRGAKPAPAPEPPKRVAGFTVRQRLIGVGLFMILMMGYGMGKSSSPDPKVTCGTGTEEVSK